MELKDKIIGVVGLGYVGLPLAVSFSKKYKVIGYDYNESKIQKYISGVDVTNEVGNDKLKKSKIDFTSNPIELKKCDFIIVAVPTPINKDNTPDINPLISSSEIVGKNLKKDCIVIYESTVYPGLTEEICMPILEKNSNMICGKDFKIAYSPERINPGDKENTFETIKKIVSGMDEYTLDVVSELYSSVLKNGIFKASSIKVAEAAKVIENTQRDINIAFMNELSMMFHKLGIDTKEVIDAASSKWNFLKFYPGLVGGHCIGVDPFYLVNKSESVGYSPNLLKASREINDGIGKFIAENILKYLDKNNIVYNKSKVLIYGITFKENVNDTRNSKIVDIICELKKHNVNVIVKDYIANKEEVKKEYDIVLDEENDDKVDVVVIGVAHNKYKEFSIQQLDNMFINKKCVFDIKGILNKNKLENNNYEYWRL